MSKVLYLDEARMHTLSAGKDHLLRLNPGRNTIEDDVFEAVLNSGMDGGQSRLQELMEKGTVRLVGEVVDITTMKAVDAIDLVELESTEEGLLDLLEQETANKSPRKTVLEAIEAKMEAIEKAKNKGSGDEDKD